MKRARRRARRLDLGFESSVSLEEVEGASRKSALVMEVLMLRSRRPMLWIVMCKSRWGGVSEEMKDVYPR